MAVTENSPYAAVENRSANSSTAISSRGRPHAQRKTILGNFVHKICGCGRKWTMRSYIDQAVEDIRAQVGKEHVILGLSGGVDSSVAAALIHKAIGKQLTCIFVNNGVLRANEAEAVKTLFKNNFKCNFLYEDTAKLFLKKLKGVTDPETKRKIIGNTFIDVFQKATRKVGKAKFLAQGTLYPDVIESVPIAGNPAALIKSHHNVGGLPKDMKFKPSSRCAACSKMKSAHSARRWVYPRKSSGGNPSLALVGRPPAGRPHRKPVGYTSQCRSHRG